MCKIFHTHTHCAVKKEDTMDEMEVVFLRDVWCVHSSSVLAQEACARREHLPLHMHHISAQPTTCQVPVDDVLSWAWRAFKLALSPLRPQT
jgi:hypothetical protein